MGSGSWIIDNLNAALGVWAEKSQEILDILTQTPETFKGGGVWNVILGINGTLKAIGLALLVLFFLVGVVKTCGSFVEVKKPEHALKLFVRFAVAKAVITWGMELMMAIFTIVQGVIAEAASGLSDLGVTSVLPQEIQDAVKEIAFLDSIPVWVVTLLGGVFVIALSFIMILSIYGRFFRLFMYTAIAPIPLSTFGGEPTSHIGKSFIKSYAAVCLEGVIIVLACVIFNAMAAAEPFIAQEGASAVSIVWAYIGELIFNLLVLVGAVKMSDRVVREMMGI